MLDLPPLPFKTEIETSADLARATPDPKLRQVVLTACSFQTLKEDAKHHSLREIAVLRRAVLAAGSAVQARRSGV